MTPALTTALGEHYRKAVIEAMPGEAVVALRATLLANADLQAESASYLAELQGFARSLGGESRLKQRDFAASVHLHGLTAALS